VSVTEEGLRPDPLTQLSDEVGKFIARPRVLTRHQWWYWLGVTGLAIIVPLLWSGGYSNNIEINTLIDITLALGFYLQFALAGQFSFATPAYYAVGAYSFCWGVNHWGFLVAFIFAIVVTAIIGGLTKLLLYRSPLIHFAIATLALASLAFVLFEHVLTGLTGGDQGKFNIPTPSIFGYQFDTQQRQYYLVAAVVVIVIALLIFFERSPAQRDVTFIRDMGAVAKTSGLRVDLAQITTFAAGAGIMGAAGALLASFSGFVDINAFAFTIALNVLLYVLLGGVGTVWGPVLGVIALYTLPQRFLTTGLLNDEDIIYAVAILVVVLILPGGVASLPAEFKSRWAHLQLRRRAT
jgi:branched-chain amino acid transport system permease protein